MTDLSILTYSVSGGGIAEYVGHLRSRLENEFQLSSEVVSDLEAAVSDTVLIEYQKDLPFGSRLLSDVHRLSKTKRVLVEVHDHLSKFPVTDRTILSQTATLLYRCDEFARYDGVTRYAVMPHLAYLDVPKMDGAYSGTVRLGWFGYAAKHKGLLRILRLARRLRVPVLLMASRNTESVDGLTQYEKTVEEAVQHSGADAEIKTGYFSPEEIVKGLNGCSHIVFAHTNQPTASGSIEFAKRAGRPIIATNTFQSRLARVPFNFSRLNPWEVYHGLLDRAVDFKYHAQHDRSPFSSYPTLGILNSDAVRYRLPEEVDGLPVLVQWLRMPVPSGSQIVKNEDSIQTTARIA
jgi:hypothetical protein